MHADPKILAMIDELDNLRSQRDDHWQIPRVEGELLFQIALATRAKVVLELGTSYGFSGLFWAAAVQCNGGTLHTIDVAQKKYNSAQETFKRAGLESTVRCRLGDVLQVIPLIEGPIDIAFIDATDKEASRRYFELVWPKIRPGGSVLIDNTTTHKQEMAGYVEWVRARTDATSTELPVGNGLEWTTKLP
jgi:predicted O-methyltransferase YrrM